MEELILKPEETELVSLLHSETGLSMPLPFERDIFLYGTPVAGTRYRENIDALYETIREGDLVTLIREPENPYDEYAIRVDVDTDGVPGIGPGEGDSDRHWMLGYVPRAYNKILARLMDAVKLLYGVVRHKVIQNESYYHIVIKIFMRE